MADSQRNSSQLDWQTLGITEFLKESKPTFRNVNDAIAIVLHFTMKKMGFKCLGCGESNDLSQNDVLLPSGWNQSSDVYSFRYRHSQSSMTFLIKALPLGEKLLIHGLALEDNHTRSFEITSKEFVNSNLLNDYENVFKDFNGLVALFKLHILDHLMPPTKEGFQPSSSSSSTSSPSSPSSSQQPNTQGRGGRSRLEEDDYDYDPLRIPPRGPRSPLGIGPGGFGPSSYPQPVLPPFGLGSHDLFPSGPGFVPPSPFAPPGYGGNLMGPNHPGFGPNVLDPYNNPTFGGPRGNGRGNGRGGGLPRSHPPGARFDPYGPPGFNNPDPDPDEPPPNSYNNMFL